MFVKLAYQHEVDSVTLLTLRMLFSFPLFLIIGFWSSKKQKSDLTYKMTKKDWILTLMFGVIGYYVASLLDFTGLNYISASYERIILYVYPTLVLLISFFVLKAKIKWIHIVAIFLTYIGVGLAFIENLQLESNQNIYKGSLFVFGAAITFAIYLVGSGQLLPKIGTVRYNSISMSAACIAIFIHNAWLHGLSIFGLAPIIYYYGIALALIGTVIPSFMMAEGIRVIGSSNASIIGSIGPISTIAMAYFLLGERLGPMQWIGTLFVIAGVLLITLQKKGART